MASAMRFDIGFSPRTGMPALSSSIVGGNGRRRFLLPRYTRWPPLPRGPIDEFGHGTEPGDPENSPAFLATSGTMSHTATNSARGSAW